jgi:hypothetical protein
MSSKAPAERKPATVVTTGTEIDAAIARGKNFVPSHRVVDATYAAGVRTPAKSAASRENGKKGGRPRGSVKKTLLKA